MANDLSSNPVRIDTFGSDAEIADRNVSVVSIVMEGATAGDTATFIDMNGGEVLRLSTGVNAQSIVWSPAKPFLFNGLTFDDSASDLASGDYVFVFLE